MTDEIMGHCHKTKSIKRADYFKKHILETHVKFPLLGLIPDPYKAQKSFGEFHKVRIYAVQEYAFL